MTGETEDKIAQLLVTGDTAAAENLCAAALAQRPDDAALWILRGQTAIQAAQWSAAAAHFTRATELARESPLAWFGLAEATVHSGGLGKAGVAAQRALKRGLSGAQADQARAWAAYGEFAAGRSDSGRRLMASAVPYYAALSPAQLKLHPAARDAATAAICAGDPTLAERAFTARHPSSMRTAPLDISPAATAAAWCGNAGVTRTVVRPAEDITVDALSPYSRPWTYRSEAAAFFSLAGGQWIPGWDYVLAPDGAVLTDTGYMPIVTSFRETPHFYFEPLQKVLHYAPPLREYVDDDVLFLSAPQRLHIGHWMIDFLPRLEAAVFLKDRPFKLAVPATLGRKHRDMLALWGYGPENLIECRLDTRYTFRTLHVFQPGRGGVPHPDAIAYVRSRLFSGVPVKPGALKKVYLARGDSRLAANAADFEALLRDEGFISIDLTAMTVAEQKENLADAGVLLGAYGTNMLAIYFAPPSATVITMTDRTDEDMFIIPTCKTVGLTHQFLDCPTAGPSAVLRNLKNSDFYVDCAELKRRLRELESY